MRYPFDCISELIFTESSLEPSDIILVPGGKQSQLMEVAAMLYHKGLAPYILPSGRYNPQLPEYPSECDFLRTIAIQMGVPDHAILKETQAAHTFDNARMSWDVLKNKGLNIRKAILVCKAYHSRRALLTYQTVFPSDVNFYVAPVIDEREIRKDNWFLDERKIQIVMREVVKIGQYFKEEIPGLTARYHL